MKVTITETCSRCKRTAMKEIDSSEIAALEQEEATRLEAREALLSDMMNHTNAPDLVVMFKGHITTIDRICDAYCAKTVRNSLDAVFKVVDPSKRKPRKAAAPQGAVVNDPTIDATADAAAKPSKKKGKAEVKEKPPQTASK